MDHREPGWAVRHAQDPLRPVASVVVLLTGVISAAANDWWWPALLLIGLGVASLAWTVYVRRRWRRPSADG